MFPIASEEMLHLTRRNTLDLPEQFCVLGVPPVTVAAASVLR